jgi:alcohol dehydrogenase
VVVSLPLPFRRLGKGHDGDIAEHGMPFVPGHELSGVVAEVGAGVLNFRVGDRVVSTR